ncbi:MAG: protein-export chaperone SecB [Pseudomonadota bacterium]
MSDETLETEAGGLSISVIAQYVRDLSFENPGEVTAPTQPQIDLGVDVQAAAKSSEDSVFEVALKLSAKAKADDRTMFICELDYAGLFKLVNAEREDLEPMLLVECPRLLFPFARRIMADITREGGFPPLLVDPVDFAHLYLAQKQKAAGNPPSSNA